MEQARLTCAALLAPLATASAVPFLKRLSCSDLGMGGVALLSLEGRPATTMHMNSVLRIAHAHTLSRVPASAPQALGAKLQQKQQLAFLDQWGKRSSGQCLAATQKRVSTVSSRTAQDRGSCMSALQQCLETQQSMFDAS